MNRLYNTYVIHSDSLKLYKKKRPKTHGYIYKYNSDPAITRFLAIFLSYRVYISTNSDAINFQFLRVFP